MDSSEEEPEIKTSDVFEWDVDSEILLFYAMSDHKPVGINKHFQMACIWEKLSGNLNREVSTHDIWRHLETLYELPMLDESEAIPFPNDESSYSLSDSEFGSIIKQKCREAILGGEDNEDGRSSSPKTATPRSSSRGSGSKDSTPKAGSRKDSISATLATKSRKESGSSHASTDTPSIKSEKDERIFHSRRDSRDSNASGPRDTSANRKSLQKDKSAKSRVSSIAARESPATDEEGVSRRGRRRPHTGTPPAAAPPKRRRI